MSTRGQSVVRSLRDRVLDGQYAPGARLNEIEISNSLNVSRTPVRAALAILAAEGLLDYVPNSGYVVRSYTVQDIEGVYAARSVLEGLAARTVAEKGLSDSARGLLHKNLSETEALLNYSDWSDEVRDAWARLNEEFHEAIFADAGNRHLSELIGKSRSIPLLKGVKFRWHDLETLATSFADHAELFDAIANGQGSRAEYLAREHVYQAGRRLIANWRRAGADTASSGRRPARRVSRAA
ncbi:GntR family transcriptional regulator [Nisaea acidiphila]|uniref:GntR family transcriptional regulator n=1 Tax=Nisaea acidiphila TaxID=1862145 RepID=A0A9J7AMW6_9PROT|nr:GntR family transcriptional regulator [Nisaea acidiphila]UUX48987.1 GntR family transcriptional regulator [Nisaea acidiphila]